MVDVVSGLRVDAARVGFQVDGSVDSTGDWAAGEQFGLHLIVAAAFTILADWWKQQEQG